MVKIKSLNQLVVRIIAANSNKKQPDLENAVQWTNDTIAGTSQRMGHRSRIKESLMESGAVFVPVSPPVQEEKKTFEYSTTSDTADLRSHSHVVQGRGTSAIGAIGWRKSW